MLFAALVYDSENGTCSLELCGRHGGKQIALSTQS